MFRLCPAVFARLHLVLSIPRGQLYFESCLGHPNGQFETLTFYVEYWEVNFPPAYATCQTVDHLLLRTPTISSAWIKLTTFQPVCLPSSLTQTPTWGNAHNVNHDFNITLY